MAQALNAEQFSPNPGASALNGQIDAAPDLPAPSPSNAAAADAAPPSALSRAASTIKITTVSAAKTASSASKERLSMAGQLRQARISLERYVNPKILTHQISEDTRIPKWVLRRAKGLVFLSVFKAGFLFAANVGTGCVIVRKPNGGWTGPSSIGVAGVSFGFLAGASKVDYIMILPDDKAVRQFTGKGQLRLGGEIQLAVGPVGRDGSGSVGAGDKGVSVVYSYSHAQGLYGGLALDGKVISVRPDCNKTFYKRSVDCKEILNGNISAVPANEDYDMIVHLLDSYCLDADMTPIQGEKLSIDDLNKDNAVNGGVEDEKEKDKGSVQSVQAMASKVQSGFGRFTSSVSQRFMAMTSSSSSAQSASGVEVKAQKEQVKLQQSGADDAPKYQIGGDLVVPDYGDESPPPQ